MPNTISVIIATFNRDALLDECLRHLERQHFLPGDEILIVDNGCTDLTPSVIVVAPAIGAGADYRVVGVEAG